MPLMSGDDEVLPATSELNKRRVAPLLRIPPALAIPDGAVLLVMVVLMIVKSPEAIIPPARRLFRLPSQYRNLRRLAEPEPLC